MIEDYHFGSITIDGETYNYDLEIRSLPKERLGESAGRRLEVLPWQRKESHRIKLEDVRRALEKNPKFIVIGTGESGMAQLTEEARKEIRDKGIELVIDITAEAIKVFNKLEEEKIIGLFHLTC